MGADGSTMEAGCPNEMVQDWKNGAHRQVNTWITAEWFSAARSGNHFCHYSEPLVTDL
jgi:hypothetical protein